MKRVLNKLFLSCLMSISLFGMANAVHASCCAKSGYWTYGYWNPPRYVCWDYASDCYNSHRCYIVQGHFGRNGCWYPAHRVCYQ